MKNDKNTTCGNCDAINSIIEDPKSGQLVCDNCGCVYEEGLVADEYEKRTFHDDNGDNQIQRVSMPTIGNNMGVNTLIRENGKTKFIRNYLKIDKFDRNKIKIQKLLQRAQVEQSFIEKTKTLYLQMAKDKNMQGRNIKHIIIGIYYYVCRKSNMAKTIKEISDMFNVSERIIKRAFNSIKKDIVEPSVDENEMLNIENNFIRTFLNANYPNSKINELASELLGNINKTSILEGKNPKTISGIALYIAFKLMDAKIDESPFYQKFSNKNTLRRSYEEIKNYLDQIIPMNFMEKANIVLKDNIF
jgi:transcription initiation factor TFIIB